MKNYFLFIALISTSILKAQYLETKSEPETKSTAEIESKAETGSIAGKLTDKEMNGAPLPFANVIIKGTTTGTVTDYNGIFTIEDVKPGTYTLVFSFVGYETLTIPDVEVVGGKETEINTALGASAAALDEVVITTVAREDSEFAMLLEQKKAITIRESIGAQKLAKLGVSDAAAATTKISGVSSSEASGDIYVRGLGDRYLSTTMNGLPIPSDDVARKNIDLELFPTSIIRSLEISKTYSVKNSADQASGTININTRGLIGDRELALGLEVGANTNVLQGGVFNKFKATPNSSSFTLGFFDQKYNTLAATKLQSWAPAVVESPIDYKYSLSAGKEFGKNLEVFFTAAQDVSFSYKKGVFREYRTHSLRTSFTDAEQFSKTVSTTGLLDAFYEFNEENSLKATSLFINKLEDKVYQAGFNGEGYVYEETDDTEGLSQFVRDQTTKQTRLWVNQLAGHHETSKKNILDWALGLNIVKADQPNRTRNEVNFKEGFVQLGTTGGSQQRKSTQRIDELEFNGFVHDTYTFIDGENQQLIFTAGANYRNKERDFYSKFVGIEERDLNTFNPTSLSELPTIFNLQNFESGLFKINNLRADRYNATLQSAAAFLSVNYGLGDFSMIGGLRYQNDRIKVVYVGNIPGNYEETELNYGNIYPSLNFKYQVTDKHNLRLALSRTITLPEFKEIAPFEYVSPTGQITRGNPELEASTNYNVDLKWEYFPTSKQLVSLTAFFKRIEDPINKVQARGSAGIYSYFNSAEMAKVYGLEFTANLNILNEDNSNVNLDMNFNATKMWHSQDLKEIRNIEGRLIKTYRYNGLTETGLEGASDWIFNGAATFSTQSDNPFMASVIANYASDKIYALGAPEVQTQSETYYNAAIIEESFVRLDALISKDAGEHWTFELSGKNLLNPVIKKTQKIEPLNTGQEVTKTVRSYTLGSVLSLGIKYNF